MKLINTSWYNNSNWTWWWLRWLVFSPDWVKQVEVNDDTEVWNNDGSLKREDNIICGKDFPNNWNDGFLQSWSYYTHERITPRFFCMIWDIRLNKRNWDNLKIKIINDKWFEKEISLTLSNSWTASVQNKPAYKNFSTNDLNNIISKQNQEKLWVNDISFSNHLSFIILIFKLSQFLLFNLISQIIQKNLGVILSCV